MSSDQDPVLLLKAASEPPSAWVAAFQQLMPELEVRVWPDLGDPAGITAALVAKPPAGLLAALPNLEVIVSLPVGLDHLLGDPELPAVPIVRCVDPGGDPMMTEFVLLHVLRHHRLLPTYQQQQRERRWAKVLHPTTAERRVGILGLGTFGAAAGRALAALGFDVAGWSRTPKVIDGVTPFTGDLELRRFIERSDIVVGLLPETPETKGIIDAELLSWLPPGASIINVGRGSAVVTADLIRWLDDDERTSATLDVTEPEPLAEDSPLWAHERVTITPHAASIVRSELAAPVVVENLRRQRSGQALLNLVDRSAGY